MMGLSLAILALAAWLVPLPLQVAEPARLVPVARPVIVEISPQYLRDASIDPEPVRGEIFTIRQYAGPSAAQAVAAGIARSSDVLPGRGEVSAPLTRPEVVAAVVGLGLSPARLEGSPVPVTVHVDDVVDPASLGVALFAFDATSALDVARGRRILAVGTLTSDQQIACTTAAGRSAAAASAAGIDLLVVPTQCAKQLAGMNTDGSLTVVVADNLVDAVDALLAR